MINTTAYFNREQQNKEQQIKFKEKLYLNYDFFSEKFLKVYNEEMTFKNVGFNTVEMNRIYEVIGSKKQMVSALFFKCLSGTKGNIMVLVRYNELYDFIIKNYMHEISCCEFIKQAGKALMHLYTEQFSKVTGSKVTVSEPSGGSGFLEHILQNNFLDKNIFSSTAYLFQGIIEKDVFECEYTVIYTPQSSELNRSLNYSLN